MKKKKFKKVIVKVTSVAVLGGMLTTATNVNQIMAKTNDGVGNVLVETIPNEQVEQVKIYRKTSLPATDDGEKKKFNINFHTLEPLGIEVVGKTKVEILITGNNVQGFGRIALHDVDNVRVLKDIPVGEKVIVEVPRKGQLFLDVNDITYGVDKNTLFDFNVEVSLPEESYIQTPVFDIRENKISGNVIHNAEEFVAEVTKPENSENGMLMISENVRIYFPQSKFVPEVFDPRKVLGLHEDTIREDNRLAGLDEKDPNPIHHPRKNFVLVSARNEQAGYMSAGGQMLDTHPTHTAEYFIPGWGMYHEYGHLYEQRWSFIEIWNNMFAKHMTEQTIGFTWLWGNDREGFEKDTIKPFYEKYVNQQINSREFDFKDGLYFFTTLEETFGDDFVANLERYWREYENLPIKADYVAHAMAELYSVNIIPYLELYGVEIQDPKLYNEIIDKSQTSFIYVPEQEAFKGYQELSVPATVKGIYEGTDVTLSGIANSGSEIVLTVNGTEYIATADTKGKFAITIPGQLKVDAAITIVTKDPGKKSSMGKRIKVRTPLSDNRFDLQGLANEVKLTLGFDPVEQVLKAKASSDAIHVYFSDEYFGIQLFDKMGQLKKSISEIGTRSAEVMAKELNDYAFEFGDYIQITHREPSRAKLYGTVANSPIDFSLGAENVDLAKSYFYITKSGLKYADELLKGPALDISVEDEVMAGKNFEVNVGIWGLEDTAYAKDLIAKFDPQVVEFIEVKELGSNMVVDTELEEGRVRILIANQNGLEEGGQTVALRFRAKKEAKGLSTFIQVLDTQIGIVVDGASQVVGVEEAKCSIQIKETTEPSDDVNQDGQVDIADLALVAYYFKADSQSPNWNEAQKADLTGDGEINIDDLAQLANQILGKSF